MMESDLNSDDLALSDDDSSVTGFFGDLEGSSNDDGSESDLDSDLGSSDDDIPAAGFAVPRNADFHELFPTVPDDDYLIEDYCCALQRDILIQGRLYISENHICFHANIFGRITELSIPIYEITTLNKKTTAPVIPNAIQLSTRQAKYTFTSFISRDTTFDVIYKIWRLTKPEDAISADTLGAAAVIVAGVKDGVVAPLRKASLCACGKEGHHYAETAIDTVIPGTPDRIHNLMFASGFMKDFMAGNQKLLDIQVSDWSPVSPESKLLTRNMSYIKPLTAPSPKQTKCEITDETVHLDFDDYISTVTTARTPEVPSGGVFSVKMKTCVMWASPVSSRVIVTSQVEWTGKSYIKDIIERYAINGQTVYYSDLEKAMRLYIQEHQSEFLPEGIDPDNGGSADTLGAAAVIVAGVKGGVVAPLRKASLCACGKEGHHYAATAMDTVIPGTPGRIHNLMFASGFMKDSMAGNQKLLDIQVSDWSPVSPGSKLLTRNMSYIKPLTAPSPKQTKCEITDETVHLDFDDYISTVTTARTPEVPSGGVFSVKMKTCVMWASPVSSRVIVTSQMEWTGKSYIKDIVERYAIHGQTVYYSDLEKAMRLYIQEHQSEFLPGIDPVVIDIPTASETVDDPDSGGSALALLKGTSKQVKRDDVSPDDIIIVVMGPTGSGKSGFRNILSGIQANVGCNLESSTNNISTVRLSIPEMAFGDLVFVYTPGFKASQDMHQSEVDILEMVAEWLKLTYDENMLLSGLLYFHRISDNRMTGLPLRNPRMVEELCGKNTFQSVMMITTMWDEVDKKTGEAREKVLKAKYWRHMLDRTSTMSRFMQTRESAFTVIDPLIDAANTRSSRLLQKELAAMCRTLARGSHGLELSSKMQVLVRQREDFLRRIRNEMKQADGDLKPLHHEHRNLQVEMEVVVNKMRSLRLPFGGRLLNMTDKFIRSNFEVIRISNLKLDKSNQLPNDSEDGGAVSTGSECTEKKQKEKAVHSSLRRTEEHPQDKADVFPKETVHHSIPAAGLPASQKLESTILPNLQVSVRCALTTFESVISPWIHPSKWLNANVKHIRAIFDGIVDLTGNKTITFPATMIFQRLIVYILAYNMLCPSNETLAGELSATLKKYQDCTLLNQMRGQGNIKNRLLTIFRNASPEHRERQYENLLKKLLYLDSIALSANVEALITDEDTYEELVETTGAGVQSLVNLLHARLDFPMDSGHKRLLVRALTRLSQTSGLYPESLTLNNVTPEHGRRATGGFADVYKGRCFGEDIAIKVFKTPLPFNVNSLNSWRSVGDHFHTLLREFITWRQLSHPNVLPFYGVHFLKDTLETRFCLVSPWMENGNVVEFLARRNRMDPYGDSTNCVCLALDIAQGVQYLHGEKIIHRDLKGYNILISASMRCYIADFGLATLTDSGSGTTLAGNLVMGTPKWLAPELLPHEEVKRNHTYASDIYAFALVCYELFSGHVPFENVQLKDFQLLLERGARPSFPANALSRRRGLNMEMENIIRDCWAQEQKKRPTADTVVERLQLLQPVDKRPLNEIGTSFKFFMHLLRDQPDNPFAILYSASHGFGLPA